MATTAPERPRPLGSLVAAATRITASTNGFQRKWMRPAQSWQADAWDMYDLVGEERFLVNTLANRMAQARFFCGRIPDDPTEQVEVVQEGPAYDVFDAFRRAGIGQTQNMARIGLNLEIPGEAYLVGFPRTDGELPFTGNILTDSAVELDNLEWRVCSTDEISIDVAGTITLDSGEKGEEKRIPADSAFVIRIWRPHPRKWWDADSPAKASLPILRELVGLTMHISAQVDSRLAGAGVFIVPASAKRAILAAANLPEDSEQDPFTEALMAAMMTPIQDRANASAVVPLVLTVPDESAELFRHISFASNLDSETRELREEAIRRLALGQDAPPEILLGVAGMNHWGAWLVREDVVTTHLEPPLALVCDALSTQYLWPVLRQQEVEDYQRYVVWYSVDHMVLRPNRGQDAKDLYAAGAIGDSALRDAVGFDESDAPPELPADVELTLQLVRQNPTLLVSPGIGSVHAQIGAILGGRPLPPQPVPATPGTDTSQVEGGPPPEPTVPEA